MMVSFFDCVHALPPSFLIERKIRRMSMVIAVLEDSEGGPFIGFQVDSEILECGECTEDVTHRLRYTSDQTGSLAEHRFKNSPLDR
jgi:hypothetical protein